MNQKQMLASKLMARSRRDMSPCYEINSNNTRSLVYAAVVGEVMETFGRWLNMCREEFVVIGGLAVSHWLKSRMTMDIDLMILSVPDDVPAFKRVRPHAFRDNSTHVEVETLTPQFINLSIERANLVFDTSIESDGVKVASPQALVVLKLQRWSRQDQADVELLLKHFPHPDPVLWILTDEEQKKLQSLTESTE
jgi:hypothetical protein